MKGGFLSPEKQEPSSQFPSGRVILNLNDFKPFFKNKANQRKGQKNQYDHNHSHHDQMCFGECQKR